MKTNNNNNIVDLDKLSKEERKRYIEKLAREIIDRNRLIYDRLAEI